MKNFKEILFYISVCIGLSISTTAFAVISGLFKNVTGFWAVITLLLAGTFCLVISNSVAVLASIYPTAPGIRTYLKKAFGDKVSLFFVFLYLSFIVMVGSVESYMFSVVLKYFVPGVPSILVIFCILAFVVSVNCYGIELPRGLQMFSTYVLFAGLAILSIAGIINAQNIIEAFRTSAAEVEQWTKVPGAVGMAIFLFVGFEWVTPMGFGAGSYKWKIPLSMPLAILLNMLLYTGFAFGLHLTLTQEVIAGGTTPQILFAVKTFGTTGAYAGLLLSALAIISTFNAGVMGGARFIFALGREGNLPKWTTKISLTTGVPVGAIITLGSVVFICSFFVVSFGLELTFAVVGSAIICFVYAMLMLALIRLNIEQKRSDLLFKSKISRPVQWFFVALLPILGILSLFSIPGIYASAVVCFVLVIVAASIFVKLVGFKKEKRLVSSGQ